MAHYDWVDDKYGTCKDCGRDFSYGEGEKVFINDKNNNHAEDELVELCNVCVHKHKVRDYTYDGMKYIDYREASQYWFGVKDNLDCWHYGDLHVDTLDLVDKYYINSRISVADTDFIEVQENSVGQYTGINDINGNMIFEGMEVHQLETVTGDDTDFTGIVVFDEGCWWIDNGKDAVRLWSETAENEIIKEY